MTHALTLSTDVLATLNARTMPVLAIVAVKFAVVVTTWATQRRTRKELSKLEPWQLRDVGLTPEQARAEAAKVFWKP